MTDEVSLEETFELSLHSFLQWLAALAMGVGKACDTWGNYNVTWELIDDLKGHGQVILESPNSYLTHQQRIETSRFLESLNAIPGEVLKSATCVEENYAAMSHPCWGQYRESATRLMETLAPAAKKNEAYFHAK